MTATDLRPGDANAPRNLRGRLTNFIGRIRRWTSSWAVWLFAVVIVLMIAGLIRLWMTVETVRSPLAILAIVFGWVGIYPVSYLAYWSGTRERKGRLEQDFLLLGLVTREDVYKVERS